MSFGFGQNNNQNTGFGGFGTNNTSSGFGQPQSNTSSGFGGSTIFGNNTQNSNGGFGSAGTGFGTTTTSNSAFSQNRPAFGTTGTSTSGGGLFGGGTSTAGTSGGFGGFGTNNNNNTSSGSMFGQSTQKPAFGGGSTGGGLFGSGNSGGGFGQTNNQATGAFGVPVSSALSQNSTECQGSGSTPFSAFTEKEPNGTTTNHFQSISFMQPYKNFSFEELRVADYNGGRRFGNSSGQAGTFGQPNFGGGFGQPNNAFGQPQNNTGSGLFSQNTTSAPAFGGTQTAQSGFGTGGGGGLFGQNKPAGSLFGSTSNASTSGGLFASANNTSTGGFGTGTNNTSSGFGSGGGIFGQQNNNQQQQSKPLFGNTTTATAGGFGSGTGFGGGTTNNNTSGGIFGNNAPNAFGQPQQQQNQNSFGGFGSTQNQNNATSAFGGFGQPQQQEQKPGGLFGNQQNSNAGGGLFGNSGNNNQQQSTGGGLFGQNQNNNQSQSSSLFNKPAAPGSLFGTTNTNTSNSSGGIFGSGFGSNNNQNQNQQNQGGGLFGNTNNQQQKPSLFSNNQSNTGGGLFGNLGNNSNQQQSGNSLFGNSGQQQQSSGSLFGNTNNNQGASVLGAQQQQQQPNVFASSTQHASLSDPGSAYGSPSIFSGLPPPPIHVGPIATPINVKQKMKKSAILPQYKMNPNASSRMVTPQKRGGFGFSYSTYGTPASASSNASTPGGLGSSLLYGSVGRGLGKSLSTSNLRRSFDSDGESILTPGAFSAGSSRYGGAGSLKRLTIDRTLRTDLFGDKEMPALASPEKNDQSKQPGILKKKVSFDASTVGGNGEQQNNLFANSFNGGNGSDKENSATPSAEEQGFLRTPSRGQRGLAAKTNGVPQQPEMEQVPRGNELAIVHEDEPEVSSAPTTRAPPKTQDDQKPGDYWMMPPESQINKMTQDEKRKVKGFRVGRGGCGYVEFNLPVDLTLSPLSDIYGKIVLIELRSVSVYPYQTGKPAQGKGMNVPSTLYVENSWPRQRDRKTPLHEKSGPRFQKHVDRLRKVGGTEFVRYEKDTGTWVFKVPHFTTYGFDYDDDASETDSLQASVIDEGLGSSALSEPPETPTPTSRPVKKGQTPTATNSTLQSFASTDESSHVSSSPNDTFQFRKKKIMMPPGAFDEEPAYEEEETAPDGDGAAMQNDSGDGVSFLGERSAVSPSDSGEDEPSELYEMSGGLGEDQSLVIRDEDDDTDVEMAGAFPVAEDDEMLPNFSGYGTPAKGLFKAGGDWAEELQRTISPRKQDRQALRETQANVFEHRGLNPENTDKTKADQTPELVTAIDLMSSLYGQDQIRRTGRNAKQVTTKKTGLKYPYPKKSMTDDDQEMDSIEQEFHASYKPNWGPRALLLYAIPGKVNLSRNTPSRTDPILNNQKGVIVSEGKDIRFAKFTAPLQLTPDTLQHQRAHTLITLDHGIPMAEPRQTPFKDTAILVQPDSTYEKTIWELASILFDGQGSEGYGVPVAEKAHYDHRIRKDRLISLWERLCGDSARQAVSKAQTAEERAIAHLSAHNVAEACDALVKGKDYRLAILVSQIGGGQIERDEMVTQLGAWRDLNVLSEMTEPIRAIYSLLAGNACVCEGRKGPSEDRARTFVISERFDLDWKRAFGLRLYYAILADEPIEAAVVKFANDLQADEGKKPMPWFIEDQSVHTSWQDPNSSQREDILWGLLKLYAASKSALSTPSIAETFAPHNTTGNPLDTRLSFQLYHALTLRFPSAPASNPFQADALAWTFATQLDSAGEWLWAMFALLHLSSRPQRHMALQSLLAFHAADIHTEPANEHFQTLTQNLRVPVDWIYEAKALFARSVEGDHVKEVGYLLKAGNWDEAHRILKTEVGPTAVIEEDWDMLQGILNAFHPGRDTIQDWGLGGQVYEDYLSLISEINIDEREKNDLLGRLLGALPNMVQGSKVGFREMVAVQEISGVVGKEVLALKEKGLEGARVLQLPLAEDKYLKHTMELSLRYYKAMMAK